MSSPTSSASTAASPRAAIIRQSISIVASVAPFGVAFGVTAAENGLSVLQALGFSMLVFSGSAQFAAVSVLGDGGTVAAAVIAGLLLNLRSLAFGIIMAPALKGPLWWRALVSQLMIDESTAVGSAQKSLRWQRFGYLVTGLGVFVVWNAATLLGVSVLGGADDLIRLAGIDATIPAAVLALLWPRLSDPVHRRLAIAGAAIALVTAPFLPPGLPILAAATAVVFAKPWRSPSQPAPLSQSANPTQLDSQP